ncbi:lipopolysaccharide biosynthesis protein [Winogradskyella sediminis]|uniref:lipopolysaccharide biosynthesis protein n=1 Tax=Winogradskyella sediminis TaxID=1382466 RepID=UPI000E267E3A|nr:lipopolysaccharide biosynthesis protein [Winogradskyella sediminis]REG89962.1 O-antigen/teichoic acid export membrane protein [Winogradskyella sediminis]
MSNAKHYIWSAVNRFGVQIIGFVGNILIARKLSPDDYGLVAMLAIFIGISWNFTEAGFADCLIRKQDADKKDYATIFVHNISFSIFLYLILYFTAPLISDFYQRTELVDITRILGLSIIIKALSLTEFTKIRKNLKFSRLAIIQLISSLVSVIVAYVMALNSFGYWAIVSQTLSIAVVNLVLIIILNKWKPYFYFSWSRYKTMRGFSNNMLLSYFTNQIGQNIYSVFIGKFQPTAILGFFNQGSKINNVSFQSINAVALTTSYPILAKERDRSIRKKMYENVLNYFLFVQFTVSLFIVGASNDLIVLLFGQKWAPTGPILMLLVISFLFIPLSSLNSNIIKIENNSQLYRNLTFLRNGLILLSLMLTYKFSIAIILYGLICARYISVIIDVLVCGKHIDFMPKEQARIALKQIVAPFTSCIIAVYLTNYFNITLAWKSLVVFTPIYFASLIVLNMLTRNKTFFMFLNKIIRK